MNLKAMLFILTGFTLFAMQQTHAVCVINESDSHLYYEIHNKNSRYPIPRVKFHSGELAPQQKACHAHETSDEDWNIYRYDQVKVFKLDGSKQKTLICDRSMEGILNRLRVVHYKGSEKWGCYDREDDRDL